ncbi:MAG: ArsR/SmtB family transcription factor [Thermomicrobiales bacterium]
MKTLEQTKTEERVVVMLRALGNPARFKIFQELRFRNSCQCGPLVDALPLAQSTVSEHLKRLRETGLVRGEIEGPFTCYCVDEQALDWLKREIAEL